MIGINDENQVTITVEQQPIAVQKNENYNNSLVNVFVFYIFLTAKYKMLVTIYIHKYVYFLCLFQLVQPSVYLQLLVYFYFIVFSF